MRRLEFSLLSSDGKSRLHGMCWLPKEEPRAVLQISHGMMDYMERYDEFARFMAESGIAVYGHDHLGHGHTPLDAEDLGYFSDKEGSVCVIKDIHRVRRIAEGRHPGVPYFLLGHSMGSFFVRKYLMVHGEGLAGALILGTGGQPKDLVRLGRFLSGVVVRLKGPRYRSKLLHRMVLGSFNLSFEPAKTPFDWISRDQKIVAKYALDPLTQFRFTAQAYYDMFTVVLSLSDKKGLARIPKGLPCIFLSGARDPVGDFTIGVRRASRQLRQAGMRRVERRFYPGARHELLNEINRADIYRDILQLMVLQIPVRSL